MPAAVEILVVLALVAANAFFVVGEYSVVTARRSALAGRAAAGSAGAQAALRLMDEPVRVISTVQVGITAVGILTGAIGEPLVRDLLGDGVPGWAAFLVAFGTVTYLSVVLGELVPKAVTLDRAEAIATLVARPIALIARVLRPVVWVLDRSAAVLLRPLGIREVVAGDAVRSPEELRAIVDEAEGAGVIPTTQEELLHNVFDFAGREVRDVLVPADQVAWVDADTRPGEAVDSLLEQGHSRFPVGRGSLDRVVGIVHVLEVARAARADAPGDVASLARPAIVVPHRKDLGALLRELRERREQLAIVADEYGRTLGIVTLEDVLEELVGDIEDEYDLPDARIESLADGRLRVAGTLTVDDLNEETGTALPTSGPRTVAGLVLDALGHLPAPGEHVDMAGCRLQVEELDGTRIRRVLVTRPTTAGS